MLLCGLCKSISLDLFLAVIVGVLACPAPEVVVLLEQQLECLADDIGRSRINEFCVPVQVMSDFFLQADLQGCRFWLLRWCFQKCQVFPLLSLFVIHYILHYNLHSPTPARGQKTAPSSSGRAGATP